MNNDLMPLVFFMLYSDDLKQQANRVIEEVKRNNEIKPSDYELMVEVENGNGKYFESVQKFMEKQEQTSRSILDALSELRKAKVAEDKTFAADTMAAAQDKDGLTFQYAQDFMDKQLQASKDIAESLSALQMKVAIIDKLEGFDQLTHRIDVLEKAAQAQKKRNP